VDEAGEGEEEREREREVERAVPTSSSRTCFSRRKIEFME